MPPTITKKSGIKGLLILLLLLPVALQAAGLGVYNPAQHAVNGFMPTQLPGLQLWLDAGKSGLTNGANIQTLKDFSVKTYDVKSASGASSPTISVFNGRQIMAFDGIDDRLTNGSINLPQPVISFCVVRDTKANNAGSGSVVYDSLIQGTDTRHIFSIGHETTASPSPLTNDSWYIMAQSSPVFKYIYYNENNTAYSVMSAFFNTTNSYLYKNGTQKASGDVGTNWLTQLSLGALRGYPNPAIGWYFKGNIAEIIFVNQVPTEAQRLQVERYLGTKYGIVVQ